MGDFTKEQREIIRFMCKIPLDYTRVLHEILEHTNTRHAALELLLLRKGMIGAAELEAAVREIEAGVMVEKALHPKIAAYENILQRALEGDEDPAVLEKELDELERREGG